MTTEQPLRFVRRGEIVTRLNVPPTRTLLEVLRDDLGACGTKEGCAEGDCGACTVVLGEPDTNGHLALRAVNACIRLAHSINGQALWTVEDLQTDPMLERTAAAHPVQQAMEDAHASQCGFCTPGFVMSLFAQYHSQARALTREAALRALSGNLCRCTGYRPIVEAACRMHAAPPARLQESRLLQKLKQITENSRPPQVDGAYLLPTDLPALLAARRRHPGAQLVAGCTDVGLWITKQHRQFAAIIDLTRVRDLRRVETYPHHIAIGAAVTLEDAYAALVAERPQLAEFAHRFAGLPVRNAGTMGGNIANGSPIGDSMPLLIALGAQVILMREDRQGRVRHRHVAVEALYTGYRQNVMRADEVLAWVVVPRPMAGEFLRVYKVSKRREDDISAVCLALALNLDAHRRVRSVRIGAGGVAATPVRASVAEAALRSAGTWSAAAAAAGGQALQSTLTPIGDMRASAAYRRHLLGSLMRRAWLDFEGHTAIDIQRLRVDAVSGVLA